MEKREQTNKTEATTPKIEQRFIHWEGVEADETRAEDGSVTRTLTGYAAVFNKMSQVLYNFREKILPGAFRDSLKRDIVALWSHNLDMVLGRSSNGTLDLTEDDKGLKFRLSLDSDHIADYAFKKIKRGDVLGMSFGFTVPPKGDSWSTDENKQLVRTLNKIELYEVSPTAFPAYPATSVSARSVFGGEELYKRGLEEIQAAEKELQAEEAVEIRESARRLRLIGSC